MLDIVNVWFCYHDVACEQIDLAVVMKTVESVCSTLGLKLGHGASGFKTNDFSSVEIHKDDNTEEVMNVDPIASSSSSSLYFLTCPQVAS